MEVWELKLYFYPSAGGFKKKKNAINHYKKRRAKPIPADPPAPQAISTADWPRERIAPVSQKPKQE